MHDGVDDGYLLLVSLTIIDPDNGNTSVHVWMDIMVEALMMNKLMIKCNKNSS